MNKKKREILFKLDQSENVCYQNLIYNDLYLKSTEVGLFGGYASNGEGIEIIVDFSPRKNVVILKDGMKILKRFNHEYNPNHVKGGYHKGKFDDICVLVGMARKIYGVRIENGYELTYATDVKHFDEDLEKFREALMFIDEMLEKQREEK